ncbi:flagellar export protein FliJ [Corallincola platygyrae]|uniref:Flagellar FliJ protein n=1 Tax=Corallincola platygyrae TaxID=1193278 RepID=A0ABW4XJK2_9GAMM
MAKLAQLQLVAKMAEEKEQQAARQLKQASERVMAEEQQETMLQQYRLDYLRQLRQKGSDGLGSAVYFQFQQFLDRLDGVLIGQQTKITEAKAAQQQRRYHWDQARKQRNAIDLLIEKQKKAQQVKADKLEQKLADEFSTQQLVRRLMTEEQN